MPSLAVSDPPAPAPPPVSGGGITVEHIKHLDINALSQSELQALSLCSSSAFDVRRVYDVVVPQVDRSVFNESAGGRRQTYSRLHHRSRSRLPGLHPSLKPYRDKHSSLDPVSHSIVHFLKHFLKGNYNPPPPPPPPEPLVTPQPVVSPVKDLGLLALQDKFKIKRRRGRKSQNLNKNRDWESGIGMELQKVNAKGKVVDLVELEEKGDELYNEELKRRTVGLETEDGVLGFLWSLEGQWCSRRRKRKFVDASMFGDVLPTGWKLLLGLRRRDYRVSVYCRRYISPAGQQFISCREVASFLKSYFGVNEADQVRDQKICSIEQPFATYMEEIPPYKTDDEAHNIIAHATSARSPSTAHENPDCLVGIENLPEVKVQDIFECFKCNLNFEDKNVYLQHLFSYHHNTTKTFKLGGSVGDGVIIKDGKFECQFCHKVFEERRSYNGHVGVHVRHPGKTVNELASPVSIQITSPSPVQEALQSRSSKMDALVEIVQSSIVETSNVASTEQAIDNQPAKMLSLEEVQATCTGYEVNLNSVPVEIERKEEDCIDIPPIENLNPSSEATADKNDMVTDDFVWNMNTKMDPDCMNDSYHAASGDIEKYGTINLEMGLRINDNLDDTPSLNVAEMVFQDGVSSVPLSQSFQFFPTFGSAPNKEEQFSVVDQKLGNDTGFEELRFDDMEPFKYGFGNGQELSSLPGGSMNLGNDNTIDDGFNSSVRFGVEEVMLNTLGGNQLTVCVWCRTEFKLDVIESETPSDSIGYMCPTCKAKISGHFSGGLSMDSHGF